MLRTGMVCSIYIETLPRTSNGMSTLATPPDIGQPGRPSIAPPTAESANPNALKILIVAGEVSGDERAAEFVRALRELNPLVTIRGMGGKLLRAANVDTVVDSEHVGAVMGVTEIGRSLLSLRTALNTLDRLMQSWRPDIIILVDFPTFNLKLAARARSLKIPVVFYIAPKVWASRPGRIRSIDKLIHHVVSIFPFERDFFAKAGFHRITYVGHPFSDSFPRDITKARAQASAALRSTQSIPPSDKIVTLFAGSRQQEVERHLPILLAGAAEARARGIPLTVVIPLPANLMPLAYELVRPHLSWCVVWNGDPRDALLGSDAGILKSGTCNLEAAYADLPFAMVYQVQPLSAAIIRKFTSLREFSIVNVLKAGTVKELLQENCTSTRVADEIEQLLTNPAYEAELREKLAEIRTSLNGHDEVSGNLTSIVEPSAQPVASASARAAQIALGIARTKPPLVSERTRLLRLLGPHKARFGLAIVCMVCYGATDGIVPFLVKYALDKVFAAGQTEVLYLFPVILILISLLRATVDFGQQYLQNSVGHRIVEDMRNRLHKKILQMSPSYFAHRSSGDLLARATADVQLIRTLLTDSTSAVLRDVVRIVALTIAAIVLDPWLALIAMVVFPIGILPVAAFGKKMRKLSRRGQEAIGTLSGLLGEAIHGNKVVKLFRAEEYEAARFYEENTRLSRTFIRSEKVRALTGPVNEVLASMAIAAIIFYGGSTVIAGTRTQGDFIAFLLAVFLMYDPFKKLSRVSGAIHQGMAGCHRIFEVLDAPVTISDPAQPVPLPSSNTLTFENISFSYERTSERSALKDVSLVVPEGKKVAIVGLSGSGKSTLVDLVPRFIDPTRGRVLIGGSDIKTAALHELRSRVTMVSQHTFLFQDTILENIRYGRRDATLEEIEEAARMAHAHSFIAKLPQGFLTKVGESGMTLSGGERQRIAIARAIVSRSPILILDEATASLDNSSEREVQRALEVLEKGRTTLVIAHRLSTIRNADLIVVMRDGCIVEQGNHDELLGCHGEYSKLYEMQFADAPMSSDAPAPAAA